MIQESRDMEVHKQSALGKRLWNVLRITMFLVRKGLISKKKLMMDMNLMMKRGKLLGKSVTNLIFSLHHLNHHSKHLASGPGPASSLQYLQEYEFSCSNSPNPVFFHVPNSNSKRKHHHYFPCINLPQVIEEEKEEEEEAAAAALVMVPKTPEYTFNFHYSAYDDLAAEDEKPCSPLVRVSNFSSTSEEINSGNGQIDDEAEEFIRRFYEELRVQSRMQLLQH